jgi:hypothetical protein
VGLRANLDAVAKRNPIPCRESNPGRPDRSLLSVLTERSWLLDLMSLLFLVNKESSLKTFHSYLLFTSVQI